MKKKSKSSSKSSSKKTTIVPTKKETSKTKTVVVKKKVCKQKRVTAAILAIVLGTFGIHKFYLKDSDMGVLYLVFCWTFLPTIAGLFEGLYYLTISEDKFKKKFCK